VTVIIPGGVANTTAADEFSNDIAKWRKGEGVLYIPEGSRIELTRR
jgi:type IV pilus biogenesis protein CpaD/CtpE